MAGLQTRSLQAPESSGLRYQTNAYQWFPAFPRPERGGREFAGDESVQSAEAAGKFDGSQTTVIVEAAEKICRRKITFLRVAFATAGDEVAVGIVLQLGKRNDMVDAARTNSKPAPAVKTEAAFPQMDGAAQGWMFEEIQLLEMVSAIGTQGAGVAWTGGDGGYFLGQADLDHVARFAALHQAQDAAGDEAPHGPTHGVAAEADTASEPGNGKPEPKLSFKAAVTEEMRIDDAVGSGHAETRRQVLELFPHVFGVGFFVFHDWIPS